MTSMDHLMELQNKQSEIRRHIAQLSAQLHAGERVRGTADLSIRYMETLSSSSQVYKPLGKLYVATSKDNLAQELALTIEKSKAESTRLETLRDQFAAKLDQCNSEIEDAINQIDKK
mmetsp:Transcript_13411/g.27279  ORF Transcript_13411/g.27279 Transcript_13411/m.27279 type:complete len:117 (+) Transcript_13411:3684-4034(+)